MSRPFLKTFEQPGPDDLVRILNVWERHPQLANFRSAFMLAVTGFPAKEIEFYPMNLHELTYSGEELSNSPN